MVVLPPLLMAFSPTPIVVTTPTYKAEVGGKLTVTNSLFAVDRVFFVSIPTATATATSCSSPTVFGLGTVANTMITTQHIVYDVAVNETLTASFNTCYKAILIVTPNGGTATSYGPVFMNSTALILTTFRIDCEFDIGASAPASPYSFQLTVQ